MKMVGAQVAAARIAKNLTQKQLAVLVRVDEETIASIEQGRRALMPDVAELLDQHLGLPGLLTIAADRMPAKDPAPAWFEEYLELEKHALSLSWYDCQVLPGMLQTESYMRALFRCRVPAFVQEEIEEHTIRRLRRAEIMNRERPPSLCFVVSEAALRCRIGGDAVHAEQVSHLLSCADLPHVTLQVLPLDGPGHAGFSGSFAVLETPEYEQLGYFEGQRGSQLITGADDVSILTHRYAMLRTQALNPLETRGLLNGMLGEP